MITERTSKMKSYMLLLLFINFVSFSSNTNTELSQYDPIMHKACGPINLYLSCRLLGEQPDFVNIMESCNLSKWGQTSFHELQRVAKENGLKAKCIHMNCDYLKKIETLAILQFQRGKESHFVLFDGYKKGRYRILDASHREKNKFVSYLGKKDLKLLWTGKAMLMAKATLKLPEQSSTLNRIILASIIGSLLFCGLWICLRLIYKNLTPSIKHNSV